MSERQTSKSNLSDDDLEFIMSNTDFERDKVLEWYENFKQQCPTGRLTQEQFAHFFKQLIKGDHADEDKYVDAVFTVFDSDNSGSVDFGEFLIAFWIRAKGSSKDKLSWIFDIYDCDKSGFITQYELCKMLRLVFNMRGINDDPYTVVKAIVEKIDRSHDGRLTRHEFIAGCMNDDHLKGLFSPY